MLLIMFIMLLIMFIMGMPPIAGWFCGGVGPTAGAAVCGG
jgi:hypothetical protein